MVDFINASPEFDKDEPYGVVAGLPGVRYAQNGHHFNARYEYVPQEDIPSMERETRETKLQRKRDEKAALKEAFIAEVMAGTARRTIDLPPKELDILDNPVFDDDAEGVDGDLQELLNEIDRMHWTQLRKEVEANGGEYQGKEEAVNFLKAKAAEAYNG